MLLLCIAFGKGEYDEDGKLTAEKLLLEKGRYAKMAFAYDTKGRIITYRNPNGQNVDYVYDNISEPILKRNPEGETYQYEYDEAGRLLSERILDAKSKVWSNCSSGLRIYCADRKKE